MIYLLHLLTFVFVIMKVMVVGVVATWSWFWVLFPSIFAIIFVCVIWFALIVIAAITS